MVVWLVGLSGAGKTTLGTLLWERLRRVHTPCFLLDGDVFRAVMGHDLGHSLAERECNAGRMQRLCCELERQGIHVVCPILSVSEKSREWNRRHIAGYFEVYLRVDEAVLFEKRDRKGLYRRARAGEISEVVGFDLPFEEPRHPDMVLDNTADRDDLGPLADRIMSGLEGRFAPDVRLHT